MKVAIVLPTLNEQGNIGPLIDELQKVLAGKPGDGLHVLVVDDDSADGTQDIVRQRMEQHGNVQLIRGPRCGLGAALIAGISQAVDVLGAEVVVTMDADFSHRPLDLPRLLAGLQGEADVVIGSRFMPGASLPGHWGWYRRFNSSVANFVARHVAGLGSIKDCTSGFRAIRVEGGLSRINLGAIETKGYAFQMVVLSRLVKAGCRVSEVPIAFEERRAGKSKVGLNRRYIRDILEFLANAVAARLARAPI
jgi:dolichol-phosphate mannosyltransferase